MAQYVIIDSIHIQGNKKTKPFIIERELPFKSGDTLWLPYLNKTLEKASYNILKTSLFNFAIVDTIHSNGTSTDILIHVVERWYLWPIPVFEQASRNINTWFYENDYDKINYGFFLAQANFRGRDELLRAIVRVGFREQYGFAYTIPHLFRSNTLGLETKALYYRQKQVAYQTIDNKPCYVYRKNYLYTNSDYSITFTYRPGLYVWHQVEFAYSTHLIHDSLFKLNPSFIYKNYHSLEYASISYLFKWDKTNSISYPTKGFLLEASVMDEGLFSTKMQIPTMGVKSEYFYSPFRKIYMAHAINYNYSFFDEHGYIFSKAFGYLVTPRGMELYLVDGNGYFLSTNSVRWELVPPKVKNIYKLKNERFAKIHYAFYLSLNADAGYVFNNFDEKLSNQWLYGYGIGLDFVTYYDIALSVDFSINKFAQKGIFFHFSKFI